MSNFERIVKDPRTRKKVKAVYLDDYFGKHEYGVRMPDGVVFSEKQINYEQHPPKDQETTHG